MRNATRDESEPEEDRERNRKKDSRGRREANKGETREIISFVCSASSECFATFALMLSKNRLHSARKRSPKFPRDTKSILSSRRSYSLLPSSRKEAHELFATSTFDRRLFQLPRIVSGFNLKLSRFSVILGKSDLIECHDNILRGIIS